MDALFKFLETNSFVAIILLALIVTVSISALIVYLVAFFQGREISFWPPKIGAKPLSEKKQEQKCDEISNGSQPLEDNLSRGPDNLDISNTTGILKVYASLLECKAEMEKDFQSACNVRLLLQIGRREMGDGVSSIFYPLAKQKSQTGTQIKILRAANDNPFLSLERAKKRGRTTYGEWQVELNRLTEIILRLRDLYHVNIEERKHYEPYLWRIFIFDDIAYVSGYLFGHGNDHKAAIYKIKKGDQSMYAIFDKYFEYLWKKYEPNADSNTDKHWVDWE